MGDPFLNQFGGLILNSGARFQTHANTAPFLDPVASGEFQLAKIRAIRVKKSSLPSVFISVHLWLKFLTPHFSFRTPNFIFPAPPISFAPAQKQKISL
jgi:hypothetical protein